MEYQLSGFYSVNNAMKSRSSGVGFGVFDFVQEERQSKVSIQSTDSIPLGMQTSPYVCN